MFTNHKKVLQFLKLEAAPPVPGVNKKRDRVRADWKAARPGDALRYAADLIDDDTLQGLIRKAPQTGVEVARDRITPDTLEYLLCKRGKVVAYDPIREKLSDEQYERLADAHLLGLIGIRRFREPDAPNPRLTRAAIVRNMHQLNVPARAYLYMTEGQKLTSEELTRIEDEVIAFAHERAASDEPGGYFLGNDVVKILSKRLTSDELEPLVAGGSIMNVWNAFEHARDCLSDAALRRLIDIHKGSRHWRVNGLYELASAKPHLFTDVEVLSFPPIAMLEYFFERLTDDQKRFAVINSDHSDLPRVFPAAFAQQ